VAVTVSADVDLDETQSTSENFQPIGEGDDAAGQVLAEKTTLERYGEAAAQTDTGVLGPDGAVVEPDPATIDVGEGGYVKDDAQREYALDRTVEQTVRVPGEITRLNVAVLIDESAVTPEQLTEIQTMVATAAGIDIDRGDQVTITRMPFDNSANEEAEALAKAETSAASKEQMMGLIRTGVIVLVIIIALFLAYRSARSARKVTAIPINLGELSSLQRPVQQLGLDAAPRFEAPALPAGPRLATPEEELQSIADSRPQEIANVLRIWLDESKARR
jgi:flagellar M-ring protein FliF